MHEYGRMLVVLTYSNVTSGIHSRPSLSTIIGNLLWFTGALSIAGLPAQSAFAGPPQDPGSPPKEWHDAVRISSFGERPAFSPDGTRVAFIGKSFGDAYEIELRTGKIRNLTSHTPHQGVMRVQYLASGDYLITAPRIYSGPESRTAGELWVLDKNLERGLMPLDQPVSEGVAVSRSRNRVAFTVSALPFDPANPLKSRFYTADITYVGSVPQLVHRQEVVPATACDGETQDFRNDDQEVTVSCYVWPNERFGFGAAAYGIKLRTGELIKYRDISAEYNEIEGVAPDGTWTTVECSERAKGGPNVGLAEVINNAELFLNPLDLCRLEMKPDGAVTILFRATQEGSTRKANNPVVSPDGQWMAFGSSDSRHKAVGGGEGIYVLKLFE